eukprot:c5501_g1_i1.p1 GENE.c5501_g1_i1~~c5501_g1_i1.p1  ORF type:complete len:373 (+),score=145.72 c5501_g1_i1:3-1121(+)
MGEKEKKMSITEKDIVQVKIAHADEEETILLAPGVPVEEINDAVKSLFPTLPGSLKGFRKINADRSLGPFIPLSIAVRVPSIVSSGTYQVQVYPAWRREGIVYEKNELHVDLTESVNLLMVSEDLGNGNSKMTLVETDVSGTTLVRSKLSGMPGCKLAFEAIDYDDVVYHPCVRLDKFEKGVLKFVPPDGQTEILRYRISKHIKLPFRVLPVITQPSANVMEVKVNVKAAFSKDLTATDVVLRIPCPRSTASYNSKVSKGTVTYVNEMECLYWKIPKFVGDSDATLSAEIKVLTGEVQKTDTTNITTTIPPLLLEFVIIGYAASGMRVRYLEIYENGEYEKESWIRYMTTSGNYQIRVTAPNVNSLEFANPQ